MTSNRLIVLVATFLGTVSGRLWPVRLDYDGRSNMTAEAVCGIISSLERSSSSLSKGVMVVAADWSADVPRRVVRSLQTDHQQPVYTAAVDHLVTIGRRLECNDKGCRGGGSGAGGFGDDDDDDGDGGADNDHNVVNAAEHAQPAACRQYVATPATITATTIDSGHALLLPPRSRYVVVYWGSSPPPEQFVALADLDYTFWKVNVYYLFVVREFDPAVRRIVYGAWRNLSIYKIVVVTPTIIKILDPFVHNAIDGRFVNVPLSSPERIPGILKSRIRNLRKFPLRIVINGRMPTVIAAKDGTYVGQDGTFAAVLAAKMNATPVYVSELSDRGKIYYGYKKTAARTYGTFAGVIDRRADVSVNGHFLKDYNCYMAELTRHITSDKVCLLAPKAGVIPPMMTVLMSFQREVWMMTAITYLIVTFIYYASTGLHTARNPGPTGCNLGLEVYRMFIGAPTNRGFAYSCQKILTSFCLIFTLVILNAFQGSLVTFLNTPMHYPDINTFKDLKESDLPIRTSSISFKELLTGDPNLKSLAYRVEKWAKEEDVHNSDGRFAGFQRVNVFNLEHFKDVLFVANKNNTRVLHTMHECLISYFISYVVHRNSPYKRRINILLSWIDQAGLVLKWNSDVFKYVFYKYKPINPKNYESSKVFSVRDLEIAFIVLSFGLCLSIAVFIVEMLTYKVPKKHKPQPPVHLPFLH